MKDWGGNTVPNDTKRALQYHHQQRDGCDSHFTREGNKLNYQMISISSLWRIQRNRTISKLSKSGICSDLTLLHLTLCSSIIVYFPFPFHLKPFPQLHCSEPHVQSSKSFNDNSMSPTSNLIIGVNLIKLL